MKVLGILGSPHKNGNTATVLNWIGGEVKSLGHKFELERLGNEFEGCMACYHCKKYPNEPACNCNDDIYYKMMESDAIILASPLHCWGFSACMKAVIDRSLCLVANFMTEEHSSLVQGKNFGLLVCAAGPVSKNLDLVSPAFKRYLGWVKGIDSAELLVPGCTEPEELGPEIKDLSKDFAKKITGA